jgi:predicted component of type VI protein secretion system
VSVFAGLRAILEAVAEFGPLREELRAIRTDLRENTSATRELTYALRNDNKRAVEQLTEELRKAARR